MELKSSGGSRRVRFFPVVISAKEMRMSLFSSSFFASGSAVMTLLVKPAHSNVLSTNCWWKLCSSRARWETVKAACLEQAAEPINFCFLPWHRFHLAIAPLLEIRLFSRSLRTDDNAGDHVYFLHRKNGETDTASECVSERARVVLKKDERIDGQLNQNRTRKEAQALVFCASIRPTKRSLAVRIC